MAEEELKIYFDKKSLLERLQHMEEDNLFRIHLVQEEEQSLELMRKQVSETLEAKDREIEDVLKNIQMLETSKNQLSSKTTFLMSNMRVKDKASSGTGAQGKKKVRIQGEETQNSKISALKMLQETTGCTTEEMFKFERAIKSLLVAVGEKQEDESNKLEMLRKIEVTI